MAAAIKWFVPPTRLLLTKLSKELLHLWLDWLMKVNRN
jgi:hypothetical protein